MSFVQSSMNRQASLSGGAPTQANKRHRKLKPSSCLTPSVAHSDRDSTADAALRVSHLAEMTSPAMSESDIQLDSCRGNNFETQLLSLGTIV
jgi:hypothetical protein